MGPHYVRLCTTTQEQIVPIQRAANGYWKDRHGVGSEQQGEEGAEKGEEGKRSRSGAALRCRDWERGGEEAWRVSTGQRHRSEVQEDLCLRVPVWALQLLHGQVPLCSTPKAPVYLGSGEWHHRDPSFPSVGGLPGRHKVIVRPLPGHCCWYFPPIYTFFKGTREGLEQKSSIYISITVKILAQTLKPQVTDWAGVFFICSALPEQRL